MIKSGTFLFRRRSHLPLLMLAGVLITLVKFKYFGGNAHDDDRWEACCHVVAALGLTVRILTVGFVPANTSGRNVLQQEATFLNTTGMYSVVRNPLYLGNLLIWLGVVLFTHTWSLVIISALVFWIYYERIMLAEEEFLSVQFGESFLQWAARTPVFIPDFRKWKQPALPFRWKPVLARENSTVFGTIVTFFVLEITGDYFARRMPYIDVAWAIVISCAFMTYVVLRWLKKSRRLVEEGR